MLRPFLARAALIVTASAAISANAAPLIVDNGAVPGDGVFTKNGSWPSVPDATAYGASFVRAQGPNYSTVAKWTPTLTKAGAYKIYVHSGATGSGYATSVPVEITYSGGSDRTRRIDQTKNGGVWIYIGTYHMAPNSGHNVVLRASEAGAVAADAVMFELSSDEALAQPASTVPRTAYANVAAYQNPEQVEIVRTEADPKNETANYQLRVNGGEYYVRGAAGMEVTTEIADAGGNAIRTYSSTDLTDEFMAHASLKHLKILVGLWLEQGDNVKFYTGPNGAVNKQTQRDRLINEIDRLKKYKAVLAWSIGNEIDPGNMLPDVDRIIYEEIQYFAKYIRDNDHWHPTTTVHAGSSPCKIEKVMKRDPDVSMVSFNSYIHLDNVYGNVTNGKCETTAVSWPGPYMVTEYSIRQPAESSAAGTKTKWGYVIEPASEEKYYKLRDETYTMYILPKKDRAVGSFVFKSQDAFRVTPTWYPLFDLETRPTPLLDAIRLAWTGVPSPVEAPRIKTIKIDGVAPKDNVIITGPGSLAISTITLTYPTGRTRDDYQFEAVIRPDTTILDKKEDFPEPIPVTMTADENDHRKWYIRTADIPPGLYRLYYTVTGTNPATASHANIPFCRLAEGETDCCKYSRIDTDECPAPASAKVKRALRWK